MMSFKPVSFESSRVKEKSRQEIREARERILTRAKEDHDRKKVREERSRQRGDDKWMLPSVESRLDSESSNSKKHKKHKKKKKKHKKKYSSDSNSSSELEEKWVEKSESKTTPVVSTAIVKDSSATQQLERDEWMTLSGLIPCVTRNELRHNKNQHKEAEEKMKNLLDQPGQSTQELNPYWKDGGTGLPQVFDRQQDVQLPEKAVGDQGVGWLRKALQRVHEQAAETGQSADEIAAERWGSLRKLENLLAEAESRQEQVNEKSHCEQRSNKYHNRRYDDQGRKKDGRESFQRDKWFAKPSEDSEHQEKRYEDRHSRDRLHEDRKSSYSDYRFKPAFSKPAENHSEGSRKNNGDKDASRYRSRHQDTERDECDKMDTSSRKKFLKPSDADDHKTAKRSYNSLSSSSASKNWQKGDRKAEIKMPAKSILKHSSSSSSSSDEEMQPDKNSENITLLSDKELNDLGAKIVKAEIFGNEALAKELKCKLEAARKARDEAKTTGASAAGCLHEEVVILTRTDSRGVTRPLEAPQYLEPSGGRRKKQKVATHNKDGERVRYFPDDDKYRLQDMFTREKLNSVEDSNYEFAKLIGKGAARVESGEADLDDMFEENARYKESDGKMQRRDREQAVREHQRVSRALEGCRYCVDSKQMLKHLIIAIGNKVYLSLPSYKSLTPGHCLLAPTMHSPCATQLDEDVWTEMQIFRKTLTKMFADKGEDVVFFETARNLHGFPHMIMECVPLDKESGSLAPIYFKKAIQECEMEWSTNKKLVELAGKGVRRSIPKGLPYFAVCFGNDDGFGHVIEDEKLFPNNFAQEIIGGILDLDHQVWRKKHNENFETQRKKVLEFAKNWSPYDFTQKKNKSSSSSDSD